MRPLTPIKLASRPRPNEYGSPDSALAAMREAYARNPLAALSDQMKGSRVTETAISDSSLVLVLAEQALRIRHDGSPQPRFELLARTTEPIGDETLGPIVAFEHMPRERWTRQHDAAEIRGLEITRIVDLGYATYMSFKGHFDLSLSSSFDLNRGIPFLYWGWEE